MADCSAVSMSVSVDCSDLEVLISEFDQWQKGTAEIHRENKKLVLQLKSLQKKFEILSQSEKHLLEDNNKLNGIVKDLHRILQKRCDLEEENDSLREQLVLLHKEMDSLEEQHKQQMNEAIENMGVLQDTHRKEMARVREVTMQQMTKEMEALENTVTGKTTEIRHLQKQLSDAERDKHTELVKLRLEYDAKLLKLQKQTVKCTQQQQQQQQGGSVNSDIYRRKLQAVRTESDKEILLLKKKVSDLEKQLSSNESKRRRY